VLDLIFPFYTVELAPNAILLVDANDKFTQCGEINDTNFLVFKDVLTQMFCLKRASSTQDYNV